MKFKQHAHRSVAALTALVLTAAALPAAVSSAEYNTWTGYVLRNAAGEYLSVLTGIEGEGVSVGFCAANGNAAYNTWYFTESNSGVTLKSALSEGEYYLQEGTDGNLILSQNAGEFVLEEDGTLSACRSGVENQVYATDLTPEPVTNLCMGDWNHDWQIDSLDLSLLRQAVLDGTADFAQQAVGDTDGNGTLDGQDIALLQRYLLGEDVTFADIQIPSDTLLTPVEPTTSTTTTIWESTTEATTEATTATEFITEVTTEATTVTTTTPVPETTTVTTTVTTAPDLTMDDFPSDYTYAANWIWENRMEAEGSTDRWNTIFDQIVAGEGTINYVVRWQSYRTVTLEQRQQFETLVSDSINAWNDWLAGWDGWEYDHIEVNIVGWAVLDESCLLDLQDDEIVYDDLITDYDSSGDTSNGVDTIPDKLPSAPSELSRFDHFTDSSYTYPGGLDKRFDMYLWATQGFPDIGGCGGDWGQRLSDTAYLNMLDGSNLHVLEHEIGHGFGLPDFYGGEGESDGYPPGGFPGGENSIMMAGSAQKITDFDGWMLRYTWSQIKDEDGRF